MSSRTSTARPTWGTPSNWSRPTCWPGITALDDEAAYRRWWVDSAERVHVIGKGIVRFDAVHWLALLTAVGRPLPTTVFVHEYLTLAGAKISQSRGAAVDPLPLVARLRGDPPAPR